MPDFHEPLDEQALRARLRPQFTQLDVVASTGSTNTDLVTAAAAGAPDYAVLIAEEQTAGLGRRSRSWSSPPGGLYLSVLLRPDGVPPDRLGTVTIVAGLALLRTVRALGADAALKWPNDLLAGPDRAKCAGILCESVSAAPPAVVVGIGVNTSPLAETTTGPGGLAATSLAECGIRTTRTELAAQLLAAFAELAGSWRAAQGDLETAGLRAEFRDNCDTLGREVRVEGVNTRHRGRAVDIDPTGALILNTDDDQRMVVSAGDVVHLRAIME
ncbi:BirA family biotin operon repressor/biotin-[acetyl-CoA-carboxylase] ligase [Tamaricihabitans halophyticus]|uniref:biotin--[biotin carboxyl-carrier protein] ligase n=1 Tax=Tamaricihabitans halophyticus TaxID=1262583 RepID=A0A4R2R0H8_9PSEU|nr:biotin--[acetyl-CoA-carboxylase] ligase [Tamaricihabitans halophyticus]TCP56130.1 BirA family biotin operon repressor/biotin-[acetyl-CoA-carboxylase] ligase [Tamaricihabitans halophyticus]